MFTFKKKYFIVALCIFIIEILIARYVNERFIRPFIGDLLVVILIYTAYRSIIRNTVIRTALQVLLFAFTVEFLQLLPIIEFFGLDKTGVLAIVIGSTFDVLDLLAYLAGIGIVLLVEWKRSS